MRRILQLLPPVDPRYNVVAMKRIIGTVKFPAKRKYPDSGLSSYLRDDDSDESKFHIVPVYRLKKARHERMVGTLCPRRSGALVDPQDWPLACISCDPNWALGIRFVDLPLSHRTIEKSMNRVVEEFKKKSIPYSCLSMREEGMSSSSGRRARFIALPILPFFFLHSPWDLTEGGGRHLESACYVTTNGEPLLDLDKAYLRQLSVNVENILRNGHHSCLIWRVEEQLRVRREISTILLLPPSTKRTLLVRRLQERRDLGTPP